MKVEFNNGFISATMSDSDISSPTQSEKCISAFVRVNKAIILGAIALFIALVSLPFGLFINFSTELVCQIYASGVGYWLTVMLIFSLVTVSISISCAVFAIIIFARKEKTTYDTLGFFFSVISLAVSVSSIILNIVGICSR